MEAINSSQVMQQSSNHPASRLRSSSGPTLHFNPTKDCTITYMTETDIRLLGSTVSVSIYLGGLRRFSERINGKVCCQQYPSDVKG